MLTKKIPKYLLISIFLFSNKMAYSDGPDNLRNEIFYVVFKDNIPYVICNQKDRLYNIQSVLLYNQQNENLTDHDLKLDLDKSTKITIPGPWLEFDSKGNPIKANKYAVDELLGFFVGDNLVIQQVTPNGVEPRLIVTIDEVIYHAYKMNSSLIFRCLPVDSSIVNQLKRKGKINNVIAFYSPFLKNTALEYYKIETAPIPIEVKKKVDEFAVRFFPSSDPNKFPYPYKHISSVRYAPKEFYFAALMSYEGGGGIFYLLDKEGTVMQTIEGEGYSRIIGILETDQRSSQSIVILYGGYGGGGIKVLSFKDHYEKRPILETKLSIATFFDF